MAKGIGNIVNKALGLNHADRELVTEIVTAWPERPRLGAQMMIDKYGLPQHAAAEELIWRDQGPYKRITATKAEHHHDFPKPHMDFLEHTIDYRVPPERAAALAEYDGSCTFDRTRGELSARCDLEGHNILTLNLAHDIVMGNLSAQEARTTFSEIVTDDIKGKYPAYTTELQFEPENAKSVKFADVPTIPGSPERPDGLTSPRGDQSDGEVLGFISAADELEVIAAITAGTKGLDSDVSEFAQMLHEEHGKHLESTLQLGQQLGVTPRESPAVDAFRVENAGMLADMLPLEGDDFARAYVDAKVKGHTRLIEMIDDKLSKKAKDEALKSHLAKTRTHIAAHLAQAQSLQASLPG